jgi:rhodanese-related sulfurtransferase
MQLPLEVSPRELKQRQDSGETIVMIDVREPQEFAIAHLADTRLIPMQTVPSQLESIRMLASEAPIAIFCHHGMRSLNVTMWLRGQGIENCFSLSGGIDRWSQEIDPAVPRY